jgi:hypothetical protein
LFFWFFLEDEGGQLADLPEDAPGKPEQFQKNAAQFNRSSQIPCQLR